MPPASSKDENNDEGGQAEGGVDLDGDGKEERQQQRRRIETSERPSGSGSGSADVDAWVAVVTGGDHQPSGASRGGGVPGHAAERSMSLSTQESLGSVGADGGSARDYGQSMNVPPPFVRRTSSDNRAHSSHRSVLSAANSVPPRVMRSLSNDTGAGAGHASLS